MQVFQLPALLLSGLFLYSAASKIVDTRPLTSTLRRLGVPERLARAGARSVPAYEILAAFALSGLMPSTAAATFLALFGGAIAVAGGRALQLGEAIPCSCFSATSPSVLGYRQIGFGGAMVALSPLVAANPFHSSYEQAALRLVAVMLMATAAQAVAAIPTLRELVLYRRQATRRYT